jgi:excisionase family DNA binding protein
MSDTLTLQQAAELAMCHADTLADLAGRGEVPCTKIGRRWVFSRRLLLEWIDNRCAAALPPQGYWSESDAAAYASCDVETLRGLAEIEDAPSEFVEGRRLFNIAEFTRYCRNPDTYWTNKRRNARNAARRDTLRPKLAEYFAWYRASKRNRTPQWADRDAICAIYLAAQEMSGAHGLHYHVDHVIPLHGASVSGLHVAGNLRVVSAFANQSKGNRLIGDTG